MNACMDRTNFLSRDTSLWFVSRDSQRTALSLVAALCIGFADLSVSEPVWADSFNGSIDSSVQHDRWKILFLHPFSGQASLPTGSHQRQHDAARGNDGA